MERTIFSDAETTQVDCVLMAKITDLVILAAGTKPHAEIKWAIGVMTHYVDMRTGMNDNDVDCTAEMEETIAGEVQAFISELTEHPVIARAVASAIGADLSALSATVDWRPEGHSVTSWLVLLAEIGRMLEHYGDTGVENESFELLAEILPALQYPC